MVVVAVCLVCNEVITSPSDYIFLALVFFVVELLLLYINIYVVDSFSFFVCMGYPGVRTDEGRKGRESKRDDPGSESPVSPYAVLLLRCLHPSPSCTRLTHPQHLKWLKWHTCLKTTWAGL